MMLSAIRFLGDALKIVTIQPNGLDLRCCRHMHRKLVRLKYVSMKCSF